jgi:hypothetical protein
VSDVSFGRPEIRRVALRAGAQEIDLELSFMKKRISLLAALIALLISVNGSAQQPDPQQQQTPPPRPRLTLMETIRKSVRRLNATVDDAKSSAEMVVSSYSDPKGGKTTIVIVNDKRKSLLGLYIYNFGSVKNAANREEVYRYLLSANDAITIGSFFVDSEDDIGYKYLFSNALPFNQTAFEAAYLAMAAVVRERRAEIRQLIGAGKDDKTVENK